MHIIIYINIYIYIYAQIWIYEIYVLITGK